MSGGVYAGNQPHYSSSGGQGGLGQEADHDKAQPHQQYLDQGMNPLLCYLCHQIYRDPKLLSCYHTFCATCLRGRPQDGKLACPICGRVTSLRDGNSLPPSDSLLRFLVENSSDDYPTCANCDRNEKSPMFFCNTCVCWSTPRQCDHVLYCVNQADLPLGGLTNTPMFYCNTCGQALCGPCRDETHRAKMFSQHDVIHMWKKTNEMHKKCQLHNEQFTMFCTTKRTMLCIKCFRDTSMDSRLHCVDLDTAYNQGTKKLERALVSIRELQTSLRDGVILFKALLDELRRNMEEERHDITATYELIHSVITQTYEALLKTLDTRYTDNDRQLRQQLNSLGSMLPTVQMHLIMCTTFSSTANKFEFLNLAYHLIDRLNSLAHHTFPLRPIDSGNLSTGCKEKFLDSLEPVISKIRLEVGATETAHTAEKGDEGGSHPGSPAHHHQPHHHHHHHQQQQRQHHQHQGRQQQQQHQQSGGGGAQSKSLPATPKHKCTGAPSAAGASLHTPEFSDHCTQFDGHMKVLNKQFGNIKGAVSDLHRDVTARRCLTSYERVEAIVSECSNIKMEIDRTDNLMDRHKAEFAKRWQLEQQRIKQEQVMFNSQIMELVGLKTELRQLLLIAQQLEPYIRSISSLMERVQPQVGGHGDHAEPERETEHRYRSEGGNQPEKAAQSPQREAPPPPPPPTGHQRLRAADHAHSSRKCADMEEVTGQGNGWASAPPPPPPPPPTQAHGDVYKQQQKLDFHSAIPEPPLAYAENHQQQRKGQFAAAAAAVDAPDLAKRGGGGLFSSFLDKVRSTKEDGKRSHTVECLSFNVKEDVRRSQPLLENIDCTGTFRNSGREEIIKKLPANAEFVQKPYEPPVLGKSSRITPVGTAQPEEGPASGQSTNSSNFQEQAGGDSVEVLSVIRYNKSATVTNTPTPTISTVRSACSSETNSLASQSCTTCEQQQHRFTPGGGVGATCGQCYDGTETERLTRSQSARDAAKSASDGHQQQHRHHAQHRSRSSSRPEKDKNWDGGNGGSPAGGIQRRSSAPEIDHESTADDEEDPTERLRGGARRLTGGRVSVGREEVSDDGGSQRESKSYTRSLERTRGNLMYGGGRQQDAGFATLSCRSAQDKKELQRAVAHIQETIQGKMEQMKRMEVDRGNQSEIKAVVHRSEPPSLPGGKTLDSDTIKQYQSIKQNTVPQKRYSGLFEGGAKASQQGNKEQRRREAGNVLHKHTSFDSLVRGADDRPASGSSRETTEASGPPQLKKQDSFEGHEAAVRSLVEAVQESRKLEAKQRKSEG